MPIDATAIEYGLIAALIAIAIGIIAAATTLGGPISGVFNRIENRLNAANAQVEVVQPNQ